MTAVKPLRALTVWQPFAGLLARGDKTVENRTWAPRPSELRPGDYLAIHAGVKRDVESWEFCVDIVNEMKRAGYVPPSTPWRTNFKDAPYGAIIGVAVLDEVREAPRGDDPWWCGPVGWYLRDPVPIEAVECRGAQGLWRVTGDALDLVRERYRATRGVRDAKHPPTPPAEVVP